MRQSIFSKALPAVTNGDNSKMPNVKVWDCFRPIPQSRSLGQKPDAAERLCKVSRNPHLRQTNVAHEFQPDNFTIAFLRTCASSHCFRQCTRAIHSARTNKTSAEQSRDLDRSRVFVVSLLPTEANLPIRHHPPHAACQGLGRIVVDATIAILPTGLATFVALIPSALSFPLDRTSLRRLCERDATALPRTDTSPWKGDVCDRAFARFTARASARFLMRPLSRTAARLCSPTKTETVSVRLHIAWSPARFPECQLRMPQCILR